MACGCRQARTQSGAVITGWEVTYPDGTTETFLTTLEAKKATRTRGGTRRPLTN